MGWTYTTKAGMTVKEFFKREFENDSIKVLDCAVVKMRTAYLAIEKTRTDGTSLVFGMVCLLGYRPSDFPYDFGYKDMDESQGLYETECPERILKLLSPVEDFNYGDQTREWVERWRKACWDNVNKKKSIPKINVGDVIKFEKPLEFRGGWKFDTMVRTSSKRLNFKPVVEMEDGRYVESYVHFYLKMKREDLVGAEIVGTISKR